MVNKFGEFLYRLRKEKGLSQVQLAEMLGVTYRAVSKWETGGGVSRNLSAGAAGGHIRRNGGRIAERGRKTPHPLWGKKAAEWKRQKRLSP